MTSRGPVSPTSVLTQGRPSSSTHSRSRGTADRQLCAPPALRPQFAPRSHSWQAHPRAVRRLGFNLSSRSDDSESNNVGSIYSRCKGGSARASSMRR
ncbi:hypothetical protein BD626DRAFT_84853 [Schizophyllum amplum]|uniref:Uncharacterized protein n=1 Tax=Schizophyllum amplum TaxID=97359 RepID=A0A550C946_9AGAR|nr:hypothetical protein BD626DRAFT_84853 [Auriculariopsis ampla]